jgi:hypothetical protein
MEEARRVLGGVSLVRQLDELPTGYLRIETPFKYPDGSSIDVFIHPPSRVPEVRLSDLGQTTAWLLDLQVRPWLSKKRQGLLEDALHTYDVQQSGGELTLMVSGAQELPEGVIRLSQACLRVADLSFTRRSSLQSTFAEEIEQMLDDAELPYESGAEIPGKYGNLIHVDFSVQGRRTRSLVLTLASQSTSAAHTTSNEIFRKWHDLDVPNRDSQFLTVFDDRSNAYRDEDLKRLEAVSTVLPFSDRAGVRDVLSA